MLNIWESINKYISVFNSLFEALQNIYMILLILILFIGCIYKNFFHKQYLSKITNLTDFKELKKSIKYFVPTKAQIEDPCEDEFSSNNSSFNLISYFLNYGFKNSSSQYYIILSDSGMGKTTFLRKLFFRYRSKILKSHKIVLVYLPHENSIEFIQNIKNKSKTILLIDAFDEDQKAIDNYKNRLNEIYHETELFYKVIITCRTQFFPNKMEEPNYTGIVKPNIGNKNAGIQILYISPFNDKDINTYLKKKYNIIFQRAKIQRAKELINKCPNLMVRPMLLAYMDYLITDKTKIYNYTYEIYEQLVNKWIENEWLINRDNKKDLHVFSEIVALYMYHNNIISLETNKIEDIRIKYNIKLNPTVLTARSLLNRNGDGLYKFAHRSIMEYLLADIAFKDSDTRKNFLINGFHGYDMLELFLSEMFNDKFKKLLQDNSGEIKSKSFKYWLLNGVKISNMHIIDCDFEGCNLCKGVFKDIEFVNVNLSHAILTDSSLEQVYFKNSNLENTYLKNANLVMVDLENTNFKNADLKKATLINTNLVFTNLENANLENVYLKTTFLIKANLMFANLQNSNLQNTDLQNANLQNSNLQNSNLINTNLKNTNLKSSDLQGLDLSQTYLKGANLNGANIKGAIFNEQQIKWLERNNNYRKQLGNIKVYLYEKKKIIDYTSYVRIKDL